MKIYLDFDDTIAKSLPAIVKIVNQRYNKDVRAEDIGQWNFKDVYPDIPQHEIIEIFSQPEFFKILQPKENCIPVLHKFCKRNELIVVSKVNHAGLFNKDAWIKDTLRDIGIDIGFVGVPLGGSKGQIDMSDAIMVDDNVRFLNETNAKYKILFDNNTKFHLGQEWDGIRVNSWKELDKVLSEIVSKEKGITNGKI